MKERAVFSSEAMLCLTFIRNLPAGWTAYPETAGFDILLVRDADGFQIGIEAKLALNVKVIHQIVEEGSWPPQSGPDCRAVLVPWGTASGLGSVCRLLGITVIEMKSKAVWEETRKRYASDKYQPSLPGKEEWREEWFEWGPEKRCKLPEYVPDVAAGNSAPVQLTTWKVKAIKIAVLVERRGYVTRDDFRHIHLDHRRWINQLVGWLTLSDKKGIYVAGPKLGTFKAQHPTNYEQIAADFEKWAPNPKSEEAS